METWIYTLFSVALVSLISLIGIFTLSLNAERLRKVLFFLVSFAVGGLFGDALIHLIPESFERLPHLAVSGLIISGILIFFAVEKFLRWRHCHVVTSEHEHIHPLVPLNLVGDSVHNFIDGMIIGASFSVSTPIGIATASAVILHEIPHEIGNFGILVHGGLSVKKALLFNFLTALTAFLGGIVSLTVGSYIQGFHSCLLPITAGGFLYIAGSDLIPELQHGTDIKLSMAVWQFLFIILGIAMMAALVLLE